MYQETNIKSGRKPKTVLLMAQCWLGAMDAAHFAARMLMDDDSQLILMISYQQLNQESNENGSVETILKKAALKDLDTIRDMLVHEYEIPTEKIIYKIVQGDLISIMEKDFKHLPSLAAVMGQTNSNPFKKGSCRNIIKSLVNSNLRPVFLISDFITIIESGKIVLAANKQEDVSNLFTNYLEDLLSGEDIQIEIITRETSKEIMLEPETAIYLSDIKFKENIDHNPKHALYDLLANNQTT